MKPSAPLFAIATLSLAAGACCAAGVDAANPGPGEPGRAIAWNPLQWSATGQLLTAMDRQAARLAHKRPGAQPARERDTLIGLGAGGMSGQFFGLEASGLAPLELDGGDRFNAPYYTMVRDASHAGISFAAGNGARLRIGALSGRTLPADPFGQAVNDYGKRFLSSAEFEQKLGRAVGIVGLGILRESGSMLGSQLGQALATNTSPTTTFTSLSAGYALTPSSSLVAMASYGRTAGFGGTDSLLAQVSEVRTVAYSFGYSASHVWRDDDRFGLTFSVPAKVRNGFAIQSGPALQTSLSGLPGDALRPLNLHPSATERDLEMTYSTPFGKDGRQGRLTGVVMWRVNPGHDASARPEWMLGVRYVHGF